MTKLLTLTTTQKFLFLEGVGTAPLPRLLAKMVRVEHGRVGVDVGIAVDPGRRNNHEVVDLDLQTDLGDGNF